MARHAVTCDAGHRMSETKDRSSLTQSALKALPVFRKRCVARPDRVCSFDYGLHVVIVTVVVVIVVL